MLICVRVFMSLRKFLIENQLGLAAICVMSLYLLSWPIRDVKETKEPDKSKAIGSRDMGKREEKENVEWKEGDSSVAAAQLQRQCKRTSFIFALFASILCFFALLCLCSILLLSVSFFLPFSYISFFNFRCRCSWTMAEIIASLICAALPSFVSRRRRRCCHCSFSLSFPSPPPSLLSFVMKHFWKLHKFFYIWTFSLG